MLARYRDVDLPIFPVDEVAWNYYQIKQRADLGEPFVRRAQLAYKGEQRSLKKVLESADELFDRACGSVGAAVVHHEWGLTKINNAAKWLVKNVSVIRRGFELLPTDYLLVAEVDCIVGGASVPSERSGGLDNLRWYTANTESGNIRCWDLLAKQFVESPSGATTLVDIDPLLTTK